MENINVIVQFKLLLVITIILLTILLTIFSTTPIWFMLTFELIFIFIIVLFSLESYLLIEIYGYLISFILIISVAIDSALILSVVLLLSKT